MPRLNELDNAAVAACEADDDGRFLEAYARMLDFVRVHGTAVDEDHLGASDLIMPPPDVTMEEAKADFNGEGLLPG